MNAAGTICKENQRLPREFFLQSTLHVAQGLLGQKLVFNNQQAIITETEAYIGRDDAACHAAKGRTKRNQSMFKEGGHAYVYLIYGMYYCLNFVTEEEGFPAAVLIRGVELLPENKNHHVMLNGPGKLTRFLGINKEQDGIDIITSDRFFVSSTGVSPVYKTTPRIGISKAKELLWRFVVEGY